MLKLPKVCLFAIDCYNPQRLLNAMRKSIQFVKFGRLVLMTDTRRHRKLATLPDLEVVQLTESDRKASPFPGHPPIALDYDRDIMIRSHEFCPEGWHQIQMEWDSAVLNPLAWDPGWLKYDFIGAPWPEHADPGWPKCTEANNVGNFGFSLKSREFCLSMLECYTYAQKSELYRPQSMSSDRFMCRTVRPMLESQKGIKFAPWDVAMRFSCENQIYSGQFGFHGRFTARLNGWGGWLADVK